MYNQDEAAGKLLFSTPLCANKEQKNRKQDMKMPIATKTTAAIAGSSLGVIMMAGEKATGAIHFVLLVLGTLWFLISGFVFVMGKRPLEMNIEWMKGKGSFLAASKDTTPRVLIWFLSIVATIAVFNLIVR